MQQHHLFQREVLVDIVDFLNVCVSVSVSVSRWITVVVVVVGLNGKGTRYFNSLSRVYKGRKGGKTLTSPPVTSGSAKETWRWGLASVVEMSSSSFSSVFPDCPRICLQRVWTSSMVRWPNVTAMRRHGTRKAMSSRSSRSSLAVHSRSEIC